MRFISQCKLEGLKSTVMQHKMLVIVMTKNRSTYLLNPDPRPRHAADMS